MAERLDFTPVLGQIGTPTLVLVGREDAISTRDEMEGIAAAIPGARFVEIAGAGHMAPLEKPDEATAAVSGFLTEVSESGRATGS
jgi:pimeloyl-ACP methyl ester carboxylesterase